MAPKKGKSILHHTALKVGRLAEIITSFKAEKSPTSSVSSTSTSLFRNIPPNMDDEILYIGAVTPDPPEEEDVPYTSPANSEQRQCLEENNDKGLNPQSHPDIIQDDDEDASMMELKTLPNESNATQDVSGKDENSSVMELGLKPSSGEVERFRLLIIGRSGCGKTTILSKVCGEEVADKPSTTRGVHDIEKKLEFQDNELFIVHDSEGFEAGQEDEFRAVVNFIHSRRLEQNINDRLHAIWYCLTTNSRPIQQSEEMFFSVKHRGKSSIGLSHYTPPRLITNYIVPIVAIFTKFDLFVEDQLQELMENVEDPDEGELEQQAVKIAMEKFETHYKGALLKLPYPPQAIVAVSNIHTSTPMDNQLTELIKGTMDALNAPVKSDIWVKLDTTGRGKLDVKSQKNSDATRLRALFASAQMADLEEKYRYSLYFGMPPPYKYDVKKYPYSS